MHPTIPVTSSAISRRSFLFGTGAIGASLAFAGCSGLPSSSAGVQHISFYVSKPEVIGYFDQLIAKFHKTQNRIRVTRDSSSNMSADFVRNAPPDLGCWNYNFSVAEFVEHGALSDLSDMKEAKSIKPALWPLMRQTAHYPGRTSAIPYSVMAASVIYNRDMFEAHAIAVPTTWSELIAVCDALQSAGVTPFYNTLKDTWTIAQGMFDYTVGGAIDVPRFFGALKAEGTNVGPDAPVSFEKNLEHPMQKMVQISKYSNPNAASRGYGDGNLAFAQGKAAMYMQGPWALNEIAKTTKGMNLGTFPLPVTENPDDLKVRVNVDLALWIPEASPNKQAAREFLSFLMKPEIINTYNADNNGFGVTKHAPPATNPALAGMQKYYDNAAFYLGPSQLIPSAIPVANYAQSIALGSDPKRVLRTLDSDWARLARRAS